MFKNIALAALLFSGLLSLGLASRSVRSADAPNSPSRSFEFRSVVHVPAMPAGSKELRLWIRCRTRKPTSQSAT